MVLEYERSREMLGEFKSLYDLMNAFPNDYYCERHLEKIRWNGYVVSPF